MSFCFKIYGTSYLKSLLEPLIQPLMHQSEGSEEAKSYEVDPARIEEGEESDSFRCHGARSSPNARPTRSRSCCSATKSHVSRGTQPESNVSFNKVQWLQFSARDMVMLNIITKCNGLVASELN